MKNLAGLLMFVSSLSWAETRVIAEETFTATFSHSGALEDVLKCDPGFRGGFGTGDKLNLREHILDLGISGGTKGFYATSDLGLERESPTSAHSRRPYAEGCQLAIDQFKAAIQDKEIVEVQVRRTLTVRPDTRAQALRKKNGDLIDTGHVTYVTTDLYVEVIGFELGGFEFSLVREVYGAALRRPMPKDTHSAALHR